jgi:hypothetical protein
LSHNNRSQRKLPGGSPPVVTYSRLREDELPDLYEDERAEPGFDDEAVAEWEAVEVPPEPPLHARRRVRPLVEEVRAPLDPDRFPDERLNDERPKRREKPKRSAAMRLVTVAALAAVVLGIGIVIYALSSSSTVTVRAPTLSEDEAALGTTDEALPDSATAVREIPLNRDTDGEAAIGAPPPSSASLEPAPAEPVNTAPVAPPAPRPRPEPPAATANVQPDFDQAAPLPPSPAAPAPAAVPQTATAPANTGADDDFIANIERTLQESRGTSEPLLSPATEQPIQLAPPPQQLLPPPPQQGFGEPAAFPDAIQSLPQQQGALVPPESIPMLDGENQPILLPGDYLIDTD